MIDPVNYTLGVQSPLQAFQGAYGLGAGIREQEASIGRQGAEQALAEQRAAFEMQEYNRKLAMEEAAAAQAAADRMAAEKKQADLAAAFERLRQPGVTAKDYADIAMTLPKDQAEAVRASFSMMKEDEQQAALSESAQIFSAFKAGRPEIAKQLILRQAEAERNAGNEQGAQYAETLANIMDTDENGRQAVEDMFGFSIAQMKGGDKAIEAAINYEKDRRAREEQPILMKLRDQELAKATTEAERAEIEKRYAERMQEAELVKYAADAGLTNAQRDKAIAEGKKISAETARILLETEAMGKDAITPEQRFNQEKALRGEYVQRTQRYNDVSAAYDTIKASADAASGAGDLSLITAFMKMLDPGSVVRETEFANARDTAGLLDRLKAVATKVQNGQFLSQEQRKEFRGLAGQYIKAAEDQEERVRNDLRVVVKSYGLNADNVFGTSMNPSDITALRASIKKMNPGNDALIDSLNEDQLSGRFPNSYAAYRQSIGSKPGTVEVDY